MSKVTIIIECDESNCKISASKSVDLQEITLMEITKAEMVAALLIRYSDSLFPMDNDMLKNELMKG